MRAAQFFGPGDFRLVEIERPSPSPGEVLLRVRAAGLCHSDLHIIDDELGGVPIRTPLTLGHEIAGEVVEVGSGVDRSLLGRRFAVFGPAGCGQCSFCRVGRDHLCTESQAIGLARDGGYAEFVAVPAHALVPVPDGVGDAEAAVATDAVLTSFHALARVARVQPGETVVVIGAGGLGLNAIQVAKLLGAYVVALDVQPRKLELARQFGADLALDSRSVNVETPLLDRRIDVVGDFVGNDATKLLAQRLVGRGGRVVLVGLGSVAGPLLGLRLVADEVAILGSFWGTRAELVTVLDLVDRGMLRPPVETHPLDELLTWVQRLREGTVEHRIALVP
jgi:propanol-preferring alcohol dehydrogenase